MPALRSPPPEEVLGGLPSPQDIVRKAQTAAQIAREQPTVDEILGRDRGGDTAPPR
jgi:hypothetical protein